jgi:intracellular proteinase inhibitor BsuPI
MRARPAVLLAAVLLGACRTFPAPPVGTPPIADAALSPLVTTLSVEPAGDSVMLQLAVSNASAGPVELAFPSGQSFDFAVRQGDRLLWQWSETMRFTQSVRSETLAAGETRAFTATWAVPAGTRGPLTARGWLTSSSHPVERTAAFRLP